ncbi:MAG: protein kinase [Myxococcota bacterium]
MDHLSPDELRRLANGEVHRSELAAIDAHLDECAECRAALVAELQRAERQGRQAASHHRSGIPPPGPSGNRANGPTPSRSDTRSDRPGPLSDGYLGQVLAGRYRLTRKLGGGGMGTVYEAEHALIGRRVAVKLLHPHFASQRDVVRRFQNEARTAALLGHPGILEALDMGHADDGAPFIVFEFLDGVDLEAHLSAEGTLPAASVVDIAIHVGEALAVAHAAGVVHRDLKPANIFLTASGDIKVLDFGVSKVGAAMATSPLTGPGAVMGTPHYMAPEQFEDARAASARSDVYALGVVMFRALTGELPRNADSLPGLLLEIVSGDPVAPRDRNPQVSPALDAIVARALLTTPEDRFGSMDALIEALRAIEIAAPKAPEAQRIRTGRRIGVVWMRRGPIDNELRQSLEDTGGRILETPLPAGEKAQSSPAQPSSKKHRELVLAVFGADSWHGDELHRALQLACSLPESRSTAVTIGRLVDGAPSFELRTLLAQILDAKRAGVFFHGELPAESAAVFHAEAEGSTLLRIRRRPTVDPLTTHTTNYPLLGRDLELAQLEALYRRSVTQRRPMVARLTGPIGIGKSRLCAELMGRLSDALVLTAAARPTRGRTYGLIADLLRSWGRQQGLHDEPALAAAADSLVRDSEVLANASGGPALAELLGVHATETAGARVRSDPKLMADQLRLWAQAFLASAAPDTPLAIFLDNVQWADEGSLEILSELLDADRAVLVVATQRESATRPQLDRPSALSLQLPGLDAEAVRELGAKVLGKPVSSAFAERLTRHTEGNPLFVEQILHSIVKSDGPPDEALPLPADVQAAMQARFDRLAPLARRALSAAAVFADPIGNLELRTLLGLDPHSVDSPRLDQPSLHPPGLHQPGLHQPGLHQPSLHQPSLDLHRLDPTGTGSRDEPTLDSVLVDLRHQGLLRRKGLAFEIRTPLVADCAYRLLAEDERRTLHLAAARLIDRQENPDPEKIAHHLSEGGAEAEARSYYRRAAFDAMRVRDADRILRCAARALPGADDGQRFLLHIARALAFEAKGQLSEERAELHAAKSLAATPEEKARALSALGLHTLRAESPDAALPVLEEAVAAARSADEPLLLARALGRQATGLVYAGRTDEATGILAEAERLVITKAPTLHGEAALWRAQLAAARGDHGARRVAYETAVELFEDQGDLRTSAAAYANLADAFNRVGEYAKAEAALRDAIDRCRRLGLRFAEGYAWGNLAHAALAQDKTAPAIEASERARDIGDRAGDARLSIYASLVHARAVGAPGNTFETLGVRAKDAGLATLEALAYAFAADRALASGDLSSAEPWAQRALAIRDQIGALEEGDGDLMIVCIRVARSAGDHESSESLRKRANERLLAAAARISDPALRRSFLEKVPAHRQLQGSAP